MEEELEAWEDHFLAEALRTELIYLDTGQKPLIGKTFPVVLMS